MLCKEKRIPNQKKSKETQEKFSFDITGKWKYTTTTSNK